MWNIEKLKLSVQDSVALLRLEKLLRSCGCGFKVDAPLETFLGSYFQDTGQFLAYCNSANLAVP